MSSKSTSVRFDNLFYDRVEAYRKLHKLSSWSEALHARDRDNLQKIEELTSEVTSLKEKQISILNYLKEKGLSGDIHLENHMSTVKESRKPSFTQFSEVACEALGYDKNGKPFCIDPHAPISTQARRHFSWEVCKFCQKKKKKELDETQKKEQQERRKALQKIREQTREYQKRINKTLKNDETIHDSSPSEEFGMCGY